MNLGANGMSPFFSVFSSNEKEYWRRFCGCYVYIDFKNISFLNSGEMYLIVETCHMGILK